MFRRILLWYSAHMICLWSIGRMRVPITRASIALAYCAIIDIAGLSFLGFGIQPPTPDWGSMLAEGSRSINLARQGQLAVRDPNYRPQIPGG